MMGRSKPPISGSLGIHPMDRPTTQAGLGGLKTQNQGPGRRVQDTTFFQSQLLQRLNSIQQELEHLDQEQRRLEKQASNYSVYEKRCDSIDLFNVPMN